MTESSLGLCGLGLYFSIPPSPTVTAVKERNQGMMPLKRIPLLWLQSRGRSALPHLPKSCLLGEPCQSSLGVLDPEVISS